jgi:hypothetical protein
MLETLIEIDEDVPAEDHVELAERSVGDEVVLRKTRPFGSATG